MPSSYQVHRSDSASSIARPISYKDLTRTDISNLTRLFALRASESHSRNGGERNKEIKDLVSDLPTHLRSGALSSTLISPCCSSHRGLNPDPLISLCSALRGQIEQQFPEQWIKVGAFKPRNQQRQFRYMRDHLASLRGIWGDHLEGGAVSVKKCPACILADLNGRVDALATLGSCLIGRVSQDMFMRSLRIFWIEEGIHGALPREEDAEREIERMWRGGMQLRALKKNHCALKRVEGLPAVTSTYARVKGSRTDQTRTERVRIARDRKKPVQDAELTELIARMDNMGLDFGLRKDDGYDDYNSEDERDSMDKINATSATETRGPADSSPFTSPLEELSLELDTVPIFEEVQSRQSRRSDRAVHGLSSVPEEESYAIMSSAGESRPLALKWIASEASEVENSAEGSLRPADDQNGDFVSEKVPRRKKAQGRR